MAHPATSHQQYHIVLRFQAMFPHDLSGYVLHEERKGRGSKHCDPAKKILNRYNLIGGPDWRECFELELEIAKNDNFVAELDALEKLGRRKDRSARADAGIVDPWKASKNGPLREVIITANKEWFDEFDDPSLLINSKRSKREDEFVETAVDWLLTRFGDAVITARADFDETAPHIHAIIAPWSEKSTKRRGRQRLLVPTAYKPLKSYELAQTDIAHHFSKLGLTRGDHRARERRLAERRGEEKPEYRQHQSCQAWRDAEAARLHERSKELDAREEALAEREAAFETRDKSLADRERHVEEKERYVAAKQAKADEKTADLEGRQAVIEQVEALLDATAERGRVEEPAEEEAPLTARIRRKLGQVFTALSATAQKTADAEVRTRMAAAQKLADAAEAMMSAMRNAVPRKTLPIIESRFEAQKTAYEEAKEETKNDAKSVSSLKTGGEIGDA